MKFKRDTNSTSNIQWKNKYVHIKSDYCCFKTSVCCGGTNRLTDIEMKEGVHNTITTVLNV